MTNLDASHKYFPRTSNIKKMTIRKRIIIFLLVYYVLLRLVGGFYLFYKFLYEELKNTGVSMIFYVLSEIINYVTNFTFILEHVVVWVLYISIADELNCFVHLVSEEMKNKIMQSEVKPSHYISLNRNVKIFHKWISVYEVIEKAANLCNEIFCWQVSFVIFLGSNFII